MFNWAALCLRALGRLGESVQLIQSGLKIHKNIKDWENAAIATSDLSEMQLIRGEIDKALRTAEKSVQFAKKSSGDVFWHSVTLTTFADAQHQAGELPDACASFAEAEILQQKDQPQYPQLYSQRGFLYCDLLLTGGKWNEVKHRASYSLELSIEFLGKGLGLHDIGLDKLLLGRASLQQIIAKVSQNNELTFGYRLPAGNRLPMAPDLVVCDFLQEFDCEIQERTAFNETLNSAKEWLDQSVDVLRKAATEHHLPRALLARTNCHRHTLAFSTHPNFLLPDSLALTQAQQDLQEAYDIAQRGGMRLHLIDYHLEATRLALTIHQPIFELTANEHLVKANNLIKITGYKRRLAEAKYLAKVCQHV